LIRSALLCDGTSDRALGSVAERLATALGFSIDVEVLDFSLIAPGFTVSERLMVLPQLVANPAVLLVHRDAEKETRSSRLAEISDSFAATGLILPYVPIVPVRMTEAWLLCDEDALRIASGNPAGRVKLDIRVERAELEVDAKSVLKNKLAEASETVGRRREQLNKRFPMIRRQLLERLDVDGPVNRLSSFAAFRTDLHNTLRDLSI
jgi:hypothetical protein